MPTTNTKKDPYGRGRRKTAIARVVLTSTKERVVNNLPFEDYFPAVSLQAAVLRPLIATSKND